MDVATQQRVKSIKNIISSVEVEIQQRVKKMSITSLRSMLEMTRDLEMHENLCSLDVRIHHRIWAV